MGDIPPIKDWITTKDPIVKDAMQKIVYAVISNEIFEEVAGKGIKYWGDGSPILLPIKEIDPDNQ